MKIRTYAKSVGFEVIGKLTYMGKRNRFTRWFMDEQGNAYLIDMVIGEVTIIPKRKDEK